MEEYNTEEALAFYQQALNSKCIDAIGPMGIGATDNLPDMAKIQQGHQVNIYDSSNMTEMYFIKPGLLPLCRLSLETGDFLQNTEEKGEYWCGLYLGCQYDKIPVGTTYSYELSNGETLNYEVLGILKKGSRFVSKSVMSGYNMADTMLYHPMDYAVICVENGKINDSAWMFSVADDYTMEEAQKELEMWAEQNKLNIQAGSLEAEIDKGEQDSKAMQKLFLRLFYLLGVTAVICILSFQIICILSRSYEYGILYANGAGTSDIIWIILLETVLKYVLACMITIVLSGIFIRSYFVIDGEVESVMKDLLMQYVYPKVCFAGLVLVAVAITVPLINISRISPVSLIGGNET